ncbi:M17 family metallopeptidase [Salinicoccus hispanicus]|uniref:Probable cytosol aminopeptidase n=1 Tax=Salinicoccus hispanicus TaxID=157225 RepID=A0A6N8U5Z2_9STAP|nr:leucyl aminopeptidase family protein [Salinicoccus hispanicus]MXQ51039.1 leucyl aminopeptidase family protein [Salinicoccus hispanicus]
MQHKVRFINNPTHFLPFLNNESINPGDVFFDYNTGILYSYISAEQEKSEDWRFIGGKIGKAIIANKLTEVFIDFESISASLGENKDQALAGLIYEGIQLSLYRFEHYLNQEKTLQCKVSHDERYEQTLEYSKQQAAAISVARDLCNEPANYLTPDTYAEKIFKIFENTDANVSIMSEEEMERSMQAVKMVGSGSSRKPRVVVIRIANNPSKPLTALVGKGVTFDSGGINVKTASDIGEMKMDMGGSAAVVGALKNILDNKIDVNVIGIIPMVENLSGSEAYVPSAVVKYSNGLHVEVGNTDAEGRLILADGILYATEQGAKNIIDIATLTGSVGSALGLKYAGILSNDERFITEHAVSIGRETGDHVWPLPLSTEYEHYLESDTADFNNMSSTPFGGAITAAVFLNKFVESHIRWVHIDMANTVRPWKIEGYYTKGAAGFGVRLLCEMVKEFNNGAAGSGK